MPSTSFGGQISWITRGEEGYVTQIDDKVGGLRRCEM